MRFESSSGTISLFIADLYKKIAGFDPATLNARPSFSVRPD